MTMKKLSKKHLDKLVEAVLQEKALEYADLIPGAGKELDGYAKKVSDFLKETSKKAGELAEEADEMMRADILNHPKIGERNRVLLVHAGIMRRLRATVVSMIELFHREG